MHPIWKKLNLSGHTRVVIANAPDSFEELVKALDNVTTSRSLAGTGKEQFILGFASTLAEVEQVAAAATRRTVGDAIVWVAYPKQSSKRYRCEFNRDSGWASFQKAGFASVRQVAIDEDWSALRFRRSEYVRR